MVNPLPIRNLSWQTFRQKVQELFQLLLNNPLRVLVTLVITRGLWVPLLQYTFLHGSFGILVALRAVCYPIEFAVRKLPKKYRRILWPYLQETLEILLRPFALDLDLSAFVVKLILFGSCIRSAPFDFSESTSPWRIRRSNFFRGTRNTSGRILLGTSVHICASGIPTSS